MTDDSSKSILMALLAVQAEAPTLPKDKTNPHFKSRYTPLDTIVEKIGPILNRHGLVWATLPGRDETGEPALRYQLMHAPTGEVLEGTMPLLLSKPDAQGMGSALTYARRYALCAVLNLVADDDDDGSAASPRGASQQAQPRRTKPPQAPSDIPSHDVRLSTDKRHQLRGALEASGVPIVDFVGMLDALEVPVNRDVAARVDSMTDVQADVAIGELRKVKAA